LDEVGGLLGTDSFGADLTAIRTVDWLTASGRSQKSVSKETGGLWRRALPGSSTRTGIEVIEITARTRQERRRQGKSIPSTPSRPLGPPCPDGPTQSQVP